MGHPLLMLMMYFQQFHLLVLAHDMWRLYHHLSVLTLKHDLRSAPIPLRSPISHSQYWEAVKLVAKGCCG